MATVPAVVRQADDRDSLLLAPGRERRARAAVAGRGGARPTPRWSTSSRCRSATSPSGSVGRSRPSRTGCGCSSCRTTCSAWSSAASSRKATRVPCSRCRTRKDAAGSRGRSSAAGCPCAPPSGPRAGPARGRSRGARRRRSTRLSPARAREAFRRLTGHDRACRGTRLEIDFADEQGLAELVEALELAAG